MTSFRDHLYAVDWDRAVRLDAGQVAAMTVTPEGQQWPWLLRDSDDDHLGCACAKCAPHEGPGPLPDLVRRRVWGTCWRKGCDFPTRPGNRAWCYVHETTACGGTTVKGLPCRNVGRTDGWCLVHAPRPGQIRRRR